MSGTCSATVSCLSAKVEERTQREFEVKTSYINLFGIDSNQSQRIDDSPSSPRRRKKRQLEDREDRHAVEDNDDIDDEDDNSEAAAATATEGEGSARRGSSGGRNT